jgi:hypothetical protein
MADHSINIVVLNTPLGVSASSDGVMGIICKAASVGTTFALDTFYLCTKLADMDTLGITFANNPALYQHITEFYAQAGDGAKLWVGGVAANTVYATYVAGSSFPAMVRGTAVADPLNQVKVIGLCYGVPTATQLAADFPSDVTATITPLHTALKSLFDEGYHLSAILDGYNMSSTVSPSALGTMATRTDYKVSVCITGTKGNGISSVGLVLGRLARISVGTSLGKVADGAIVADTMFLTNGIALYPGTALTVDGVYTVYGGAVVNNAITYTKGQSFTCGTGQTAFTSNDGGYVVKGSTLVSSLTPSEISSLGAKQFLFGRTWIGKSGYYWNDGATAEAANFALAYLEFNRLANKLSTDALNFFINEIGSPIPVDAKTGAADAGYLLNKQQEFANNYIAPLKLSNDISDASMTITGPNFLSTRTLVFDLKIVASPALNNVSGTIQFTTNL